MYRNTRLVKGLPWSCNPASLVQKIVACSNLVLILDLRLVYLSYTLGQGRWFERRGRLHAFFWGVSTVLTKKMVARGAPSFPPLFFVPPRAPRRPPPQPALRHHFHHVTSSPTLPPLHPNPDGPIPRSPVQSVHGGGGL